MTSEAKSQTQAEQERLRIRGASLLRYLSYTRLAGDMIANAGIPMHQLEQLVPEQNVNTLMHYTEKTVAQAALVHQARIIEHSLTNLDNGVHADESVLMSAASQSGDIAIAINSPDIEVGDVVKSQVQQFVPFLINKMRQRLPSTTETQDATIISPDMLEEEQDAFSSNDANLAVALAS